MIVVKNSFKVLFISAPNVISRLKLEWFIDFCTVTQWSATGYCIFPTKYINYQVWSSLMWSPSVVLLNERNFLPTLSMRYKLARCPDLQYVKIIPLKLSRVTIEKIQFFLFWNLVIKYSYICATNSLSIFSIR